MFLNVKQEILSAAGALHRFWTALSSRRQLLALMLLAVVSLLGVVVLYMSDGRLSRGSWHSYGGGLFSVQEDRMEHFLEFNVPGKFKNELERRGGGRLLGAYQKTLYTETGEVHEIIHINVFSLESWFKHIFSDESSVYRQYFAQMPKGSFDYEVKRVPDFNGHPAIAYKSRSRDYGGFYVMGVVVCAHRRAYYYECYSHYSPFYDRENDEKTYFYPSHSMSPTNFTVDDMESIKVRFFLLSFLLYGGFLASMTVLYRLFTGGMHRHSVKTPIMNAHSKQRYNFMVALSCIMLIIMLVMLVSFWQFRGPKTLQSVAYVVFGMMLLMYNLPMLIHYYKKARMAPMSAEST